MGAVPGGEYASETCQEGCFRHDLGKFAPEFKLNQTPKNGGL
jgi:hypothetical protein